MPYAVITTKMTHSSWADWTASSIRIVTAEARFTPTSHRWRPTLSTTTPASGAASEGAYTQTDTTPAWALLPVSDFTQIPATKLIALLPSSDTVSPPRYSRALRLASPSAVA